MFYIYGTECLRIITEKEIATREKRRGLGDTAVGSDMLKSWSKLVGVLGVSGDVAARVSLKTAREAGRQVGELRQNHESLAQKT